MPKKPMYTEEELIAAVEKSTDIQGVMEKVGLVKTGGGSHANLSEKIKSMGLDTSHFKKVAWNKGMITRWTQSNEYKQKCVDYKGGECEICGYNKCNASLAFHHTDPKTKKFGIASTWSRSWPVVKEELDKCRLLCQNCHHELHFNQRKA